MQPYRECDLSSWSFSPPTTNAKGNKQASIIYKEGKTSKPVTIQLCGNNESLRCPFGASSWGDALTDRLNLDFSAPASLELFFENADEKIIELATNMSEALFGKKLNADEVRSMYMPMVKHGKADYNATIRTKVNMTGRKALRCYDKHGISRKIPDDFRSVELTPGVLISHLWFQGKSFGVVVESTHCIIHEMTDVCPFSSTSMGIEEMQ